MFVSLLLLFKKNLFQLISLFSETIQLLVRAQVMLHKNKQKKTLNHSSIFTDTNAGA